MIPGMSALEAAAGRVLESIPSEITRGELSVCLYEIGLLGHWVLPRLKKNGIKVVRCYDANPALNGIPVDGVVICDPSNLRTEKPDYMIVTSRHAIKPVSTMLSNIGIPHVSYDAWHVAADFSTFRQIHDDVLTDERSKEVVRAVLMAMLTGDTGYCEAVYEKDQYFCLPRFCGSGNEIYVDAGAFVGDSIEKFIWAQNGVFAKIYGFEPGPRQFDALRTRVDRLKTEWAISSDGIEVVKAGLGESEAESRASAGGPLTGLAIGHSTGARSCAVSTVTLDSFLRGDRITFLKADVEGMEMALLRGARSTIQRHKPKIGISVYHYSADIPVISLYLRELVPEYKFALRHHSPLLMETVLYCWTE